MDQNQPELTFDESVAQVMQTLPPVIRAYLAQGKYTVVAKSLMAKYGLRIDQGGVLEREIMLLLMGIENPEEFTQALVEEAKLNKQTVDSIVQDVNAQIFIPLRQEMMKSGVGNVPQPPKPAPPTIEPPKGIYAPPLQSPSYFHLDNKIPTAVRHAAPSLREVLSAVTKEVQKPISGEKLLEDHEEPHIEFHKAAPQRPTPPPPPNLPGALPPRPIPEVRPSPAIPKVEPPTPSKPYSSDPYREPIDEK